MMLCGGLGRRKLSHGFGTREPFSTLEEFCLAGSLGRIKEQRETVGLLRNVPFLIFADEEVED